MILEALLPLLLSTVVTSLQPDYGTHGHHTGGRTLSTRQQVPQPCHYDASSFQIDQQYNADSCPGNIQGVDNDCRVVFTDFTNTTCNAWCQARTRFFYGTEWPFLSLGYFVGPVEAKACPQDHVMYRDVSGKISWENYDVIHSGTAGGNELVSYGSGMASDKTVELQAGQCGYFSFVPVLREVCGSRTWGDNCSDSQNVHNELNICSTSIERHLDPDTEGPPSWPLLPNLVGQTIFVRTNCSTYLPLPKDQQQLEYNANQVALPDEVYKSNAEYWRRTAGQLNNTRPATPEPDCAWSRGVANANSCLNTISFATTVSDLTGAAVYTNATHDTVLDRGLDPGCQMTLYQDERWTAASCKTPISHLEIFAAVQNIVDKCSYENYWVHGIQKVRELGDCGSSIGVGHRSSGGGP